MNARNVRKLIINDDIRYIGARAFKGCCKIIEVKIPVGISILNEETFKGCVNLRMVKGCMGVKVLKKGVFDDVSNECKMEITPNTVCIFE